MTLNGEQTASQENRIQVPQEIEALWLREADNSSGDEVRGNVIAVRRKGKHDNWQYLLDSTKTWYTDVRRVTKTAKHE